VQQPCRTCSEQTSRPGYASDIWTESGAPSWESCELCSYTMRICNTDVCTLRSVHVTSLAIAAAAAFGLARNLMYISPLRSNTCEADISACSRGAEGVRCQRKRLYQLAGFHASSTISASSMSLCYFAPQVCRASHQAHVNSAEDAVGACRSWKYTVIDQQGLKMLFHNHVFYGSCCLTW
jgi:hypothetical protein